MKYQTYARQPISQTDLTKIAKFCVRAMGISWKDAISKARNHRGTIWARQVAQYLCRECTGASLGQIGSVFKRDHSGVLHSHRAVQDFMEVYPEVRVEVEALKAKLIKSACGEVSLSVVRKAA